MPMSRSVLLVIGLIPIVPVLAQHAAEPVPGDPIAGIVEAFQRSRLVAISEAHGLQQEHDFIVRLVSDSRFASVVRNVVVEFGNALYQAQMDRYMAGEEVPAEEVQKAWRNTALSPLSPFDAPVYERFFATVRALNASRPQADRIRVVLADIPVDWAKPVADIEAVKAASTRDTHFHQVIQREVLARGTNALLLFGGGHLYRHWWNPFLNGRDVPLNLIDLLEGSPGSRVFVVMVHAFLEPDAELERRLRNWNRPSLASLKGTWLGDKETEPLLSETAERGFPDGRVAKARINGYAGLTLADLADGYLYLGSRDSLTLSVTDAEFFARNQNYAAELRRRFALMSQGRTLPASFFESKSPRSYFLEPGLAAPAPSPPPKP
jgi:hypothetical protein